MSFSLPKALAVLFAIRQLLCASPVSIPKRKTSNDRDVSMEEITAGIELLGRSVLGNGPTFTKRTGETKPVAATPRTDLTQEINLITPPTWGPTWPGFISTTAILKVPELKSCLHVDIIQN
ncbi:hypothetical protein P154DRAFT_565247 [Amniculicola lignicola CBS 123094]|uniref:Uncharacterized protein n=1 Tax=Amniculicola lignicola CBS 123094 TaxID=1392246 RepID=A0A6A5W9Y0_9PLEO|nr:hypothetical protein P154DRAFT_565247 [Amniculicola lignicola CBS 123094]